MSLFRLDASIRVEGSVSREIADIVEEGWTAGHPDEQIVRRHVGTDPIPSTTWVAGVTGSWTPAEQRTSETGSKLSLWPPHWSTNFFLPPTPCSSPCRSTTSGCRSTSRPTST